ncbi:hypothetical protein C8R44DRAFT_896152 [Mycena epipterygia]|nr:hypothetical protein C8R44DRAFT_896152 [Mycena epipterygia]
MSGHATARHARDSTASARPIHLHTLTHIPGLPPATGTTATSTATGSLPQRHYDTPPRRARSLPPAAGPQLHAAHIAYLQRDSYRDLPRPRRVPLPVLSPTAPVARRELRYTLAHPYSEHASPFFPVSAQAHLQRHSCLHAPARPRLSPGRILF